MDFLLGSILWGLLWFLVSMTLVMLGLGLVWRVEQNKWLSWFGLHRNLPWFSLVAAFIGGLLGIFLWYIQPAINPLVIFLQIIIIACLIVSIVSDAHFSVINLHVLAVGSLAVLAGIIMQQSWLPTFASAVAAAAVATIFFLWQYLLSRGQWVGSGDAWLGAFLGLLAGWHEILIVAAIGYGFAAIIAFVLIIFFRQKNLNRLPLGAFLAFSALAFFLFTIIS